MKNLLLKIRYSFPFRLALYQLLATSLLLILLTAVFLVRQQNFLENHLIALGKSQVNTLVNTVKLGLFFGNPSFLKTPVDIMIQQAGIIDIQIYSRDRRQFYPLQDAAAAQSNYLAGYGVEKINRRMNTIDQTREPLFFEDSEAIIFAAPVFAQPFSEDEFVDMTESVDKKTPAEDSFLGYAFLAMDKQLTKNIQGYIRDGILIGAFFITIGILIIFKTSTMVSKPLTRLLARLQASATSPTTKDADSRLNEMQSTPLRRKDDFSLLDDTVTSLTDKLEKAIRTIEQQNATLERTVQERTGKLTKTVDTLVAKEKELTRSNNDLQATLKKLQQTQMQLIQSEKLNALGQLIAGIAHEMNNSINFIYGALPPLKTFLAEQEKLFDLCADLPEDGSSPEYTAHMAAIERYKEKIHYQDLPKDITTLINNISTGARRSKDIITNLITFARRDEHEFHLQDVHEGIESTLKLLHSQYKNRITIIREFTDNLPEHGLLPNLLNQVFMNIIMNAIQAIRDEGTIVIRTAVVSNSLHVLIQDDGPGIPPKVMDHIFDPFFTTKAVGKGTGLGLSICYNIIEKANGVINVRSPKGQGAEFEIIVPYKPAD